MESEDKGWMKDGRRKARRREEEVRIKDGRKEEEVRMKDGGRKEAAYSRKQNEEADSDVLVGTIVRRMSSQNFFVIKKNFSRSVDNYSLKILGKRRNIKHPAIDSVIETHF